MIDWIESHQAIVWGLGVFSLALFVGSLLAAPAVAVRIPRDYFAHERRPPSRWAGHHAVIRIAVRLGRNVLGAVFVIGGVAMLALPGQGLLTLALGVLLIDFPGKYRFERWLVGRRWILRPINWLRRRRGREPLRLAGPSADEGAQGVAAPPR